MSASLQKSLQVEAVTQSRREIFNICALLARAMEDHVFTDKNNPILVFVNGTVNGGKSIVPDAMRQVLLASASPIAYAGLKSFDEHWFGRKKERDFEIAFNNTRCEKDLEPVLSLRSLGGIGIMSNTPGPLQFGSQQDKYKSSMDIWIESDRHDIYDAHMMPPEKSGAAKAAFDKISIDNEWRRYIKIAVNDERLCASSAFNKALKDIETGAYRKGRQFGVGLSLQWYVHDKLNNTAFGKRDNARQLKAFR